MRKLIYITTMALVLAAAAPMAEVAEVPGAEATVAVAEAAPAGTGDGGKAGEAGTQLGDIVRSWGGGILLAVAGVMGIAALVQRNVGMALSIFVICLVVGGFIWGQESMQALIEAVWEQIG